jgi:cytochrome P450
LVADDAHRTTAHTRTTAHARCSKFVRGVAHKVIAERRKKENWREVKDLLTLLMKSQDSESGEGLSDDQIAIELEVFISAGHETTAHCTCPTQLT